MKDTFGEPVVSVITPCLNPGYRLERCIASVASQSYGGRVEHLIIDGGSTDGTIQLLKSMPAGTWLSEPDSGQSDAINKGFRLATGSVLTWLNSDDEFHPGTVASAVGALQEHADAGWVYGDLEISEAGERIIQQSPPQLSWSLFNERVPVPQPGTFFTRWALKQVGELDEALGLAMDLDLWVRFLRAGIPSVYVPRVLATFELHPGSKTAQRDLEQRFKEQTLVYARHELVDLAARAMSRWSWWVARRDFIRSMESRRIASARDVALRALSRSRQLSPRKRGSLLLMLVAPRLAQRLMQRRGRWQSWKSAP